MLSICIYVFNKQIDIDLKDPNFNFAKRHYGTLYFDCYVFHLLYDFFLKSFLTKEINEDEDFIEPNLVDLLDDEERMGLYKTYTTHK